MITEDSHKIKIRTTLLPGDLGELIRLHGILYEQEYGFDKTFEAYVARGLADFVLNYDSRREGIWGGKRTEEKYELNLPDISP